MIIIGAGLAGLLAAHRFRTHSPVVLERQEALPTNHHAVLRFRSNRLQTQFGIPLKKVRVTKAVLRADGTMANEATLLDNNAYSLKVSGALMQRSIGNLAPVERWEAPMDLLPQLAKGVEIRFNHKVEGLIEGDQDPTISTMPMPSLMKLALWPNVPIFDKRGITVIRAVVPGCDLHQTLYCPHDNVPWYRVSVVGEELIVELPEQPMMNFNQAAIEAKVACYFLFGSSVFPHNITFHHQPLGKIIDVDPAIGRAFVMYATDRFNTYSVGRFALWRNIVTDDVLDDLDRVAGMIESKSAYQRRLSVVR